MSGFEENLKKLRKYFVKKAGKLEVIIKSTDRNNLLHDPLCTTDGTFGIKRRYGKKFKEVAIGAWVKLYENDTLEEMKKNGNNVLKEVRKAIKNKEYCLTWGLDLEIFSKEIKGGRDGSE